MKNLLLSFSLLLSAIYLSPLSAFDEHSLGEQRIWLINACNTPLHVSITPVWPLNRDNEPFVKLIGPMEYVMRIQPDATPHKITLGIMHSTKNTPYAESIDLSHAEKCTFSAEDATGRIHSKTITIEGDSIYLARFLKGELAIEKLRREALAIAVKRFKGIEE